MPKIIKIDGFTNVADQRKDTHLVIACHGMEGSGKTRFLTTMPGPMGIIPCDRKTRATVKKEIELLGRRDIFMPPEDFIRHENPMALAVMDEKRAKQYYSDHVGRIQDATFKLVAHQDVRSVAVDGGSQLWEDILFKHYGRNQRIMPRDRGPANQDMIDFLAAVTGKHFAITLKSDYKWENDKQTNVLEPKGMRNMGYHVTVVLRMANNKRYNPQVEHRDFNWQFSATIEHCQLEPRLQIPDDDNVLKDEFVLFQSLAAMVFPDEDQGQFQMEAD
jgi:hypothetical protein